VFGQRHLLNGAAVGSAGRAVRQLPVISGERVGYLI